MEQLECKCPDWWFPSNLRSMARNAAPGPHFSHHSSCPKQIAYVKSLQELRFDNPVRVYPTSCQLHADGYHTACTAIGSELQRLRLAIEKHRAQKADDRCIEDDDELYAALGDGIKCDRRVGDKEAMRHNCERFINNRCEGGGWPSYAELEAILVEYKEGVTAAHKVLDELGAVREDVTNIGPVEHVIEYPIWQRIIFFKNSLFRRLNKAILDERKEIEELVQAEKIDTQKRWYMEGEYTGISKGMYAVQREKVKVDDNCSTKASDFDDS